MSKGTYIIKSQDEMLNYTLGVVYEPDTVDLQDDFAEPDIIRDACWDFMKNLQNKNEVSKLAENLLLEIGKAYEENIELKIDITKLLEIDIEKQLGDMHESWSDDYGDVVEMYIAPTEFKIGKEVVKKGTWLAGIIWSDDMFEKVLKGERTGLSMGGSGIKVEI